jgi:oligopeptidase B
LSESPSLTKLNPPIAKIIAKETVLHGETLQDPYFWLREKENPEVRAYLEAENSYADAVTAPLAPLSASLYDEMLARIQEDDMSAPYRFCGYDHRVRTEKGRQYAIHERRKSGDAGAFETVLDVNALAAGKTFMSLGAYMMSDDGAFLAYSTDETGFRQYRLHVKNLLTGAIWNRTFEKTISVAWAADSRTVFFTEEDHAKRAARLYRVEAFTDSAPELVFEESDERFSLEIFRSRSGAFLFLVTASHTTTEFRLLDAATPAAPFRLISGRRQDHEYEVDHQGDRLLIRTNDRGRNFRLVETPLDTPGEDRWREIVPQRDDVMLEGVLAFENATVLCERALGLPRFRVFRTDGTKEFAAPFDEPTYTAFPQDNRDYKSTSFRYSYQSLVTPLSVFDLDLDTGRRTLAKQTQVLGGFDRDKYVSEFISATAPDGTSVPVSLVRRRDTPVDGSAPMHLLGYGSYGYPYPVTFLSTRLSLLDRGFVIALAHVRGGGEMGKPWHDAGRMATKANTFTDFVACADDLIRRGYTSSARLVIEGGSAGGLLMGAVINLRPDLMKAVVAKVPFVDVINSMLDEELPLTVGEFEEWGNPKILADYRVMRSYCPYTNLARRAYPAILLRNSFNDSQVMYWEAAKYAAKLRTLKTNDAPLLLRTLMDAGHGGASGRYDALRETASDYAFILWQTGLAGVR